MDLPCLITDYIHLNAVLCAGFLSSVFLLGAVKCFPVYVRPSHILKINQALMIFVILFPIITPFIPQRNLSEPTAQIWSAPSMRLDTIPDVHGFMSIDVLNDAPFISFNMVSLIITGIILAGIIICSVRVISGAMRSWRLLQCAHHVRVIGKVRILVSESTPIPFSVWYWGRAYVVIPSSLIANREQFNIAVTHELQHHRQRDTIWAYALQVLKIFFFWNPAVYLFERNISEIQELACDEFLVVRRKIPPVAYCLCLIRVAELTVKRHARVYTVGLPLSASGKKLKRRIRIMYKLGNRKKVWRGTLVCTVLSLAFMVTFCFASQGLVQDRRISMPEAIKLAEKATEKHTGFPIVVNDSVLTQLNRFLGTPDGRTYMREALSRMEEHRDIIERKLKEYGAPPALMAVPIVESGYRNIVQNNKVNGAGLWQFIPSTANHFGLRVDDQVDERLKVEIETDAAIRYLVSTNLRFRDWGLSLLAYNAGAGKVQEGIDATGIRDAWSLIQAGYENDKDYLSKLMAALIIMCNQSSLE